MLLDPNLCWLSVPFSVGEGGYRDCRLEASSNSKDFLKFKTIMISNKNAKSFNHLDEHLLAKKYI